MIWLRTWRLGIKSLLLHPLRTCLTVIGILFGVASVIWLLAIGEGISQEAQRQIEGLGADNIMVRSVKPLNPPNASANSFILAYGLLREDFHLLQETIPPDILNSALPIREMRRDVRYADKKLDARVVGCTPEYATVTHLFIDRGHFITDAEVKLSQNHCVLAEKVVEVLFPYEDPLGRRIFLQDEKDYYTIVGVCRDRPPTAAIGGSLDAQDFSQDVYIPISTMRKRIGDTIVMRSGGSREGETLELNQITLRINGIHNVEKTAGLVEATLEKNHGKLQDTKVIVPLELLEQAKRIRIMLMVCFGMVAAISLVVGGIGIMNIMLATVTERTREIGIRRALGACRRDIVRQFLVETIAMSVLGGIMGVLLGLLFPPAVEAARNLLTRLSPESVATLPSFMRDATPVIVPASIPLAFCISVVIGIVFGLYPAYRAAQMDPIEALRHE